MPIDYIEGKGGYKWTSIDYLFTTTGCRTIKVEVDTENMVLEANELNNTYSQGICIYELLPDLLIYSKDIVFSNVNPSPYETVNIYASIHNVREGSASDIEVAFYIDHTRIALQTIPFLAGNSEVMLSQEWIVDPATPLGLDGSHVVRVEIDPDSPFIPETGMEKLNNVATRAIIVGALPAKPDLAVSSNDIAFSDPEPIEGDKITINATIHNIGSLDAYDVLVQLWDGYPGSGTQIGTNQTLDWLAPDATSTLSIDWTATVGDHDLYITIDPDNVIDELDETNNKGFKPITVKPLDIIPPNTTISLEGDLCNEWWITDLTVTLTAEDDLSEVNYTKYSFDSINWNTYSHPFLITQEGFITIYYYSVDTYGNKEEIITEEVRVDKTPPEANAGVNQTVNEDDLVTFDGTLSTDNIGIISYSWDFNANDEIQQDATTTKRHTDILRWTIIQ